MKSYIFLFWGYNVVWIGLVVYVGLLILRLQRVARRLDRIERRVFAGEDVRRP